MQAGNHYQHNHYQQIVQRVQDAARLHGRDADTVRIIGVSKYVDADATRSMFLSGCHLLGESRPQSLWAKAEALSDLSGIEWHMIGHMQRNKIARTLPIIRWLHSLDSLRLAESLQQELVKQSSLPELNVLLEVNVTQDQAKTGLAAHDAQELLEKVIQMPRLKVRGLMAMSTEGSSPEQALQEFQTVRALRDQLQQHFGTAVNLNELSMGMSNDFEQAIAAGATMVRLGSILWDH